MSFPYLGDLVRQTTGMNIPLPIPTFGLMVAIAILTSLSLLAKELQRLHAAGRIGLANRRVKQDGRYIDQAVSPQDIASELTMVVVLFGFVGARVFHILEYADRFVADPWTMIFSRSGFTIYGGMIFGTIAGAIYLKRRALPVLAVLDAVAPAIMLGYAIGRIGCQISGDGDWGIAADLALKPSWVPTSLWAQTYDHNIAGIFIAPPGVYPTPIYETAMAAIAFGILWGLRKHTFRPGWLFAAFMLLYGIERFLIESIRVNSIVHVFGIAATQAQFISVATTIAGLTGLIVLGKRTTLGPTGQLRT